MNRTTALIITLAILLAHTLAIYKTSSGEIAPPFDMAHVAYRIARNFVHNGNFAWDVSVGAADSYPSLLWIGVATVAERLYLPVGWFCQITGLIAALACALVVARFSRERLAGVIAPLLFVVSGGIASAAMNGMETSTLALLLTFSFLAYERGWRAWLMLSLTLACATRPQAVVFTITLLAFEVVRRGLAARKPAPANSEARPSLWLAFAVPIAVALVIGLLRRLWTGHFMSDWGASLFTFRPRVAREGVRYMRDFLCASGGPALFVFPLWYLLRRSLTSLGVRACILTVVWCASVALNGGGALPFFEALTPILAILFVAVQEAMQIALDSKRRGLPQVTWALFLAGLGSSTMVSKFPGDLGPFKLEALHRAWMMPHTLPRFGYLQPLGRAGLSEEILSTERLREIGIFLREHLDPSHTVLTPWPGAIGYLSRMRVIDALGRTAPSPGADRTKSWNGLPRADVVKTLAQRPDYIVPTIRFGEDAPTAQQLALEWSKSLDVHPEMLQRRLNIRSEFVAYELITVPVVGLHARFGILPRNRFYLMRRKELELTPKLEIALSGREFTVSVTHRSHEQLVDLRVQVIDREGAAWSMRPTGEFERRNDLLARSSILLHPTGERRILLLHGTLPAAVDALELHGVLRNPGAVGEALFSAASDEVLVKLR